MTEDNEGVTKKGDVVTVRINMRRLYLVLAVVVGLGGTNLWGVADVLQTMQEGSTAQCEALGWTPPPAGTHTHVPAAAPSQPTLTPAPAAPAAAPEPVPGGIPDIAPDLTPAAPAPQTDADTTGGADGTAD